MKEKITVSQAKALGVVMMSTIEDLKEQIDDLGELKGNATEALRMLYNTNLKDGRVFEIGIIIREKEDD